MNDDLLPQALRLAAILTKRMVFTHNDADYEDVLQVARIAAWQATQGWDAAKGRWSTYGYTAIRNAIWKEQARLAHLGRVLLPRRAWTGPGDEEMPAWLQPPLSLSQPIPHSSDTTEKLEEVIPGERFEERSLDRLRLREALEELTPRQRAIIDLQYLEQRNCVEIAALIGGTRQAVWQQSERAVAYLRWRCGKGEE